MSEHTAEKDAALRGRPTLHRCPACPSYMNHDGKGGLYCPSASEHRALAWVPNTDTRPDTIHRAGCAHLNLTAEANPLAALDVEDARAEIADAMGWQDYPEDEDGAGFDIAAAPCTRVTSPGVTPPEHDESPAQPEG